MAGENEDDAGDTSVPTTVYVMRDATEHPLYIGCTSRYIVRVVEHRWEAWYGDVVSVDFQHFKDRAAGFEQERKLISELRPTYNVRHKQAKRSLPTSWPTPLVAAYMSGALMKDIAAEHGVTKQRVHQIITEEAPTWLLAWERRRRETRRRMRCIAAEYRRNVARARLCRTCGDALIRASGQACEGSCQWLLEILRQHLPDNGRVARLNNGGRWLVKNSDAWHAARLCMAQQFPLFEELPESIQRQVRIGAST